MRSYEEMMRRVRAKRGRPAAADGPWTAFVLRCGRVWLQVVVSIGGGWDHASVTVQGVGRCPTWQEMCCVREVFFEDDEWVVQFHPPAAANINAHPFCLHLWRPTAAELPLPPKEFV